MSHNNRSSKAFGLIFAVAISLALIGNIVYNGTRSLVASFRPDTEDVLRNDAQMKKNQSLQERFDDSLFFNKSAREALNSVRNLQGGDFTFVDGVNDIYRDDTGRMTYICRYRNMRQEADALSGFSEKLEDAGIPLLYVQIPFNILRGEDSLHYRIRDYSNDNADRLLTDVSQKGVDTFDLRDVLKEPDRAVAPLFFQTDSRWRVNTSFDAYLSVLTLMDHQYHLCRDTAKHFGSRENFTVTQTEPCFIGDQGRLAVRPKNAQMDTFDYIKPYSRTSFKLKTVRTDGTLTARSGDYSAALMAPEQKGYDNLFDSYLGAPAPLISMHNELVKTGEKLVILGDDFINPFASFTALNFTDTIVVNPALFRGSIQKLIDEQKPDLVLVMYQPKSFENPKYFQFR